MKPLMLYNYVDTCYRLSTVAVKTSLYNACKKNMFRMNELVLLLFIFSFISTK